MAERTYDQMPITSGYTLELRCCVCLGKKYPYGEISPDKIIEEITGDGPDCYYYVRRIARRKGWILHKDGYATCPKCSS